MECAICLEEGNLIKFNHNGECGNILVHDSCLTDWFLVNNNECIICRKNLINDYKLLESDEENTPNSINILIDNNNNNTLVNNYKCINYFCKLFVVFIIFLFLLYILIILFLINNN